MHHGVEAQIQHAVSLPAGPAAAPQVSMFSGCMPCSKKLPRIVLISLSQVQCFLSQLCLLIIRYYADQRHKALQHKPKVIAHPLQNNQ